MEEKMKYRMHDEKNHGSVMEACRALKFLKKIKIKIKSVILTKTQLPEMKVREKKQILFFPPVLNLRPL